MSILSGAYRLFFPAAGLYAALSVPLWLAIYMGADLPQPSDGFQWHRHDMLFGYFPAALAGFLLTAVPNWTGRAAMKGLPLLALFLLWLIARVAVLLAHPIGGWSSVAFLLILGLIVMRELHLSEKRRNMPVAGMVFLFAIANILFLIGHADLSQRMVFALALVMITLIGGRIVPAFSRNWLKARGVDETPAAFGPIDIAAMVLTLIAGVLWAAAPGNGLLLWIAGVAALAQILRLLRWKGLRVAAEPLLLALHLGYLWVPGSLGLIAYANAYGMPESLPGHAIGVGAIGSMTLIVMIRALLGHSGRAITGNWVDWVIILLVHIGAVTRVLAGFGWEMGLHLAALLWPLGFLIFVAKYTPIAVRKRSA